MDLNIGHMFLLGSPTGSTMALGTAAGAALVLIDAFSVIAATVAGAIASDFSAVVVSEGSDAACFGATPWQPLSKYTRPTP